MESDCLDFLSTCCMCLILKTMEGKFISVNKKRNINRRHSAISFYLLLAVTGSSLSTYKANTTVISVDFNQLLIVLQTI